MSNPLGAILAGLAGGASTLGTAMDDREKLNELKKERAANALRQLAKDALDRQQTLSQMGAVLDTGKPTRGDVMGGIQDTGGSFIVPTGLGSGDATGAIQALARAKQREQAAYRFDLPDLQTGKPVNYRIDEEQTPDARAMRRLAATQRGQMQVEYAKQQNAANLKATADADAKKRRAQYIQGVDKTATPEKATAIANDDKLYDAWVAAQYMPKPEKNIDPLSDVGVERQLKIARAKGGGSLPAPAVEKMIELDSVDNLAKSAHEAVLAATRAGKSVGGRVLGVAPVPAWVRNNLTHEGGEAGATARNLLGDLTSQIGKMRSGGAITPQEFNRLDQFLPNANDNESTMLIKLKNMRKTFADIKRIRIEDYQKYGGKGGSNVMTESGKYGGVILEPPPED